MSSDDHRKVEDALQAIRSLVEASGIDSDDDGTIKLDSIVWRGSLETKGNETDENLISLHPLEAQMQSDNLDGVLDQPLSQGGNNLHVTHAQIQDTSHEPSMSTNSAQAKTIEDLDLNERLSSYDTVAFDDPNGFGHQQASRDISQSSRELDPQPSSETPEQLNAQAALEIQETRALLAEFQNLLDSTMALKNASLQRPVSPVSEDVDNKDSNAANLSALAKAALDARLMSGAPELLNSNRTVSNLPETNSPEPNSPEPNFIPETAQRLEEDTPYSVQGNDEAENPTPVSTSNTEQSIEDSNSAQSEVANLPADPLPDTPDAKSEQAARRKLSNIALHLVDVAERTEPEYKSLFTSAVRSTMQDIIRRQMTDWLTANMTDIIEDALRDELQPATSNNPKSTNRRDKNS